jgi:hypothetical protein
MITFLKGVTLGLEVEGGPAFQDKQNSKSKCSCLFTGSHVSSLEGQRLRMSPV